MKRELNLAERMVLETEGVEGLRERGINVQQKQVVYVVVDAEEYGCGPSVVGVFTTAQEANRVADQYRSAFVSEQVLEG